MSGATTVRLRRFGRTGNNVLQIIHALAYCERHGHRLVTGEIPEILPPLELDFSGGLARDERWMTLFYLTAEESEGLKLTHEQRKFLAETYLTPRTCCTAVSADEGLLTVHLRSGDALRGRHVHKGYVQPPLAFYRRVIEDFEFRKILVVTEPDLSSPALEPLRREYGAEVLAGSVGECYAALMGARNLCPALSSFSGTAALLSLSLQRLFLVSGKYNFFEMTGPRRPTFCPVVYYALSGYIEAGRWTASPEQLKEMVAFPLSACRPDS